MDFDFGNLEGAWLLGVEWSGTITDGTAGTVEFGLHFQGSAAAPAAALDLASNEEVFATRTLNVIPVTAASVIAPWYPFVDLSRLNIQILSNIAAQIFNSSGVNRTGIAKVYYKRLLFSAAELGAQLAVRR